MRFQVICCCRLLLRVRITVLHDHSGRSVADRLKQANEKATHLIMCASARAVVPAVVYVVTYTSMAEESSAVFKEVVFKGQ